MIPTRDAQLVGAAAGWQGSIKGTLLNVAGTLTRQDLEGNATGADGAQKDLANAAMGIGTYYFFIPTAGCQTLDLTFRLAASGGGTAPTITLWKTLSDNITMKGTAATAVTTVTTTQATTQVTPLVGERGVVVKMVAAATFKMDTADYSAL